MKKYVLLFLIVVMLLSSACTVQLLPDPTATQPDVTEAAPADATPAAETSLAGANSLAAEALKNATYSGIYDESVTLTDGKFENDPYLLQYLDGTELDVDLDGDGVRDAVVFLNERGGGTAANLYAAAQLNREGKPVDGGVVLIDSNINVIAAGVEAGQVKLQVTTRGPGDVNCCATYKADKRFALVDGRLAAVSGDDAQDLVRVSASDLNGTSWRLLELSYGVPALPDAAVTIDFQDGEIGGSGGCNNYNSSFTLSEDNPFVMTMGPVAATMMACPAPIMDQERAFLAALEKTTLWGYDFGNLALGYVDDQGMPARLLFAPAAPEITSADGEGAMAEADLPSSIIAND